MKNIYIGVLIAALVPTVVGYAWAEKEDAHSHAENAKAMQDKELEARDHDRVEEHTEGDAHGDHLSDSAYDHDKDAKHERDVSGEDGHGHDEEESAATALNTTQMALADIKVEPLVARVVEYQLYAPGEILSNGYTSYRVSPRVASVVLRRHVALGDHVKQGQPLVTLFSESVARTQAEYQKAWSEWQRVRALGRKTVGEQRYVSAQSDIEAAEATLLAYGVEKSAFEAERKRSSNNLGEYTLRAEIDGAVLADEFEQGQRIEPGAPLIMLADEKQLWVEAHLPADMTLTLGAGTLAEVRAGAARAEARVSQEAHTIDPITRTRTVRLLVDNLGHRLHPGQFAEVFFRFRTDTAVLAVPESALMRGADGDWTVFVENAPGKFEPVEVELGRALGSVREIVGIEPGKQVVMQGAFFVASQIAKGGFDPHNH
ncbi:MAG: efflux RND transporter periplasmic adaptor subunit [Azoarcus sp.]|nr:efflux RND transporter periplasmic adaptor subunit [Azoarcus sp.]